MSYVQKNARYDDSMILKIDEFTLTDFEIRQVYVFDERDTTFWTRGDRIIDSSTDMNERNVQFDVWYPDILRKYFWIYFQFGHGIRTNESFLSERIERRVLIFNIGRS